MSTGVAILGSTGSIGKTALAVIRNMPGTFHVVGLAAGHRVGELEKQIREFSPGIVSVAAEADAVRLRKTFSRLEVLHGMHGAVMVADTPGADTVVAAIVGSDGLASTYRAVERGKRVALANKESLVMAGRLVMGTARRTGAELLPVDSEHCAIFQCMRGESPSHVRKIILTASGGALRDQPIDGLEEASIEKVLAHPTWSMGRKITVDSATMVNKGFADRRPASTPNATIQAHRDAGRCRYSPATGRCEGRRLRATMLNGPASRAGRCKSIVRPPARRSNGRCAASLALPISPVFGRRRVAPRKTLRYRPRERCSPSHPP